MPDSRVRRPRAVIVAALVVYILGVLAVGIALFTPPHLPRQSSAPTGHVYDHRAKHCRTSHADGLNIDGLGCWSARTRVETMNR